MYKKSFGFLALIGVIAFGAMTFSQQSNSEGGDPYTPDLICYFHHPVTGVATFIGLANTPQGCLVHLDLPVYSHLKAAITHHNPLDCISTEPFN